MRLDVLTSTRDGRRPLAGPQFDAQAAIATLTPQQTRVFDLLGDGLSNKAIARILDLEEVTIKAHLRAIREKLRCDNRVQVALISYGHRHFRNHAQS
ncbi:MAG: response regulator transcription factor [Proteobacteria bacterium]|nr:response regulator transcription factor [Pseudomonadota bacterium]